MSTIVQSRSAFFGVGFLVGIFGPWGALSFDAAQLGVQAPTPAAASFGARAPEVSGFTATAISVRTSPVAAHAAEALAQGRERSLKEHRGALLATESATEPYQVERACCPGE
jgi:hypothetical protein